MKYILFVVIVLLTTNVKAQEPCRPDRAPDAPCGDIFKFSEHGNLRWTDERASLDGLADIFRRSSNQLICFLIYPGVDSCKDEARLRALRAKKYLVQHHRIPQNDIVWKSGGFRKDLSVEIWLLPKGKPLPEPDTSFVIDPAPRLSRKCKELKQVNW
jgi:hypothetical protein